MPFSDHIFYAHVFCLFMLLEIENIQKNNKNHIQKTFTHISVKVKF